MQLNKQLIATAVAAALVLPLAAAAQTSTGSSTSTGTSGLGSTGASNYSLIPSTSRGYIGANIGKSEIDFTCPPGARCEDADFAGKIYTGGMWSEVIGVELGYMYFGSADVAGGDVDAQGANLSLVGNLPISEVFNVFAKVGTTYSWTEATSPLPGFVGGKENGFGLSYGAGVGFDLTQSFSIVGEWERHRLRFVGGDEDVDMFSLGAKYRF